MRVSLVQFWKIIFSVGMALCLVASGALAGEVQVSAEVNNASVLLGDAVMLTISAEGSQDVSAPSLPTIDGFDAQYIGPSQRISIINGHYSASISHTYSLLALKVGQFEIPAIDVNAEGKVYKTQPIEISVTDSPAPSTTSAEPQESASQSLKDKIFVVLKAAKEKAYLNSRVPIKVFLFVSDIAVRDIQFPQIETNGFTLSDFGQPRQYAQVVNGIRYEILEFDAFLYPTRTGSLSVGPAKINGNILLKSANSRASGRMGSIFEDDFFNDFFNRYEKRPMLLESTPLTLNVEELPAEGKPENFSDAVGHFDFDATVSPLEVKEGDPITVRMKISGDGNISSTQFPKFDNLTGFKTYEPTIKEQDGTKILEQVLIPTQTQIKEVPAVEFSYFDDEAGVYRRVVKGPFSIQVSQDPEKDLRPAQRVNAVTSDAIQSIEEETLGEDIVFIKETIGHISPQGKRLTGNISYWLFVWIILGVWAVSVYTFYHAHRMKTDVVFAKKLRAPRDAKKRLEETRKFLQNRQTEDFYGAILKTLQHYISGKFHVALGHALDADVMAAKLVFKDSNQKKKILLDIKAIVEECEMVRYAAASLDLERMKVTLQKVEQTIDFIERFAK
jgi:hypothetical protein